MSLPLLVGLDLGARNCTLATAAGVRKEHRDLSWPPSARRLSETLRDLLEPGEVPPPSRRVVIAMPAGTLRVHQRVIREAASGLCEAMALVPQPLAVGYGLRRLRNVLIVDIGARTTDLALLRDGYPMPEDCRSLPFGGDWLDRELQSLLAAKHPTAGISIPVARRYKEAHGFVGKPRSAIEIEPPLRLAAANLDISTEIAAACNALLPPVIEALDDLIDRTLPEEGEWVPPDVVLTGGGCRLRGLVAALQAVLDSRGGGRVRSVRRAEEICALGAYALGNDLDDSSWRQLEVA